MLQDDFKTKLYKYVKNLIKSTSYHLEGTESKLTEIPHYLIHMSLYKNSYENAVKFIVANHEISETDFKRLAENYAPTGKVDELIKNYSDKKKALDFPFKKVEFNEYPFYKKVNERETRTALQDLIEYCNNLVDFINGTSIDLQFDTIPFLKTEESEEGIVYLYDDNLTALNLEASLLGIDSDISDIAEDLLATDEDKKKKRKKSKYNLEYKTQFDENLNSTREQAWIDADTYFETLHSALKDIFLDKYLISILDPLFKLLLKLEFGNNLSNAITATKNKFKENLDIQINNKNIAELLNISESTFSNYGTTAFPEVEGLYRIADIVESSCDTLLGNISQDSINDEYIYNKYGLTSDTLRHLEQLKSQVDAVKGNTTYWCEGLNKSLQSLNFTYLAIGKNKIEVSGEEIQQLQLTYQYACEIINDNAIPTNISNGYFVKTKGNIEVKYTKTQRIVIDTLNNIQISKSKLFTKYSINEKLITHKTNDPKMYIKYKCITNYIMYEEYKTFKENQYKGQHPTQYHVIGDIETDFLSAVFRFLNNRNDRVYTMSEKEFNTMQNECTDFEEDSDLPDIEGFLQDVYSNYGYTTYETDNLYLLEITDKLRRYKEKLIEE